MKYKLLGFYYCLMELYQETKYQKMIISNLSQIICNYKYIDQNFYISTEINCIIKNFCNIYVEIFVINKK